MEKLQLLPVLSDLLPSPDETDDMTRAAAALSDPHRLHILALLAAGRGCCNLPDCCIDDEHEAAWICVCELTEMLGMIQSKVSYHIAKLKEAKLVRERRRGKWTYYAVDRREARRLLTSISALFESEAY